MKNTASDLSAIVKKILPQLEDYIETSMSGNGKVLKQELASKLSRDLGLTKWIKEGGLNEHNVSDFLQTYLDNSQRMHHPHYIGHQVSSSHLASAIADFICGAINNPMAIYEMGPSAAVIEQTMVNWMLQKAGWFVGDSIEDFSQKEGNGSGVLTHGGSMANLTALLAARARIAPEAWEEGNPGDLVVIGSEVAHYSIARAISIIGMGNRNLVTVPTTKMEVLKPEHLEKVYKQTMEGGKRVMSVVANACATSTGLYDPIDEIGQFCNENGLWFHVDGAHGASALVSNKEKHFLEGLQRADSMIWDTHKMLRTSTLCAAVLFKDSNSLANTFQQKGSYLFHDKEKPGFDLMPYTIECTKAGIGTKLFWVLAAEGEKGLSDYIDNQYDITRKFHDLISAHPDFECPYYPEANIICFRYISGENGNDYQLAIRNVLVKRGDFYITSTEISGVRYLRMTVINALTKEEHVTKLLEEIVSIAID
ncbi:MAG: L-2,4-diaminobutyrate decarboxylase [Saprospiraceae bacterium]|jgi:L-2,4-diaminobutyrate decarboxylase